MLSLGVRGFGMVLGCRVQENISEHDGTGAVGFGIRGLQGLWSMLAAVI